MRHLYDSLLTSELTCIIQLCDLKFTKTYIRDPKIFANKLKAKLDIYKQLFIIGFKNSLKSGCFFFCPSVRKLCHQIYFYYTKTIWISNKTFLSAKPIRTHYAAVGYLSSDTTGWPPLPTLHHRRSRGLGNRTLMFFRPMLLEKLSSWATMKFKER